VGFLGGVLNHSDAFGETGCQHDINGGPNADDIEVDVGPYQLLSPGCHHPMLDLDLRPQGAKTLNVLVYGPEANVAASWQSYLRPAIAGKEDAKQIVRCAHLFDQIVGRLNIAVKGRGINRHTLTPEINLCAQLLKDLGIDLNIGDVGQVFNCAFTRCEKGCGDNRNGRILAAANCNASLKRFSSSYY